MATAITGPITQFAPYIFFYGRCEEALQFYARVFNGSYDMQRVGDVSFGGPPDPATSQKIMHATFSAPGISFMASDGREEKTVDPDAGNISLAITLASRDDAMRAFNALGDGGQVLMPLGDAPWGGSFGIIHDRFGNEWMVSAP